MEQMIELDLFVHAQSDYGFLVSEDEDSDQVWVNRSYCPTWKGSPGAHVVELPESEAIKKGLA